MYTIATPSQCTTWLADRAIEAHPYGKPLAASLNYQRVGVEKSDAYGDFVGQHVATLSTGEPALLQMQDWSAYGDASLPAPLIALQRVSSGTFDAPGVEFDGHSPAELAACCAFIVNHGQTAYLYLAGHRITALFWEGEFIELWGQSAHLVNSIANALGQDRLRPA